MKATLIPPLTLCFFQAKPVTFRSRLHGLFLSGFIVAPISSRPLSPLMSALQMAALTPGAVTVPDALQL